MEGRKDHPPRLQRRPQWRRRPAPRASTRIITSASARAPRLHPQEGTTRCAAPSHGVLSARIGSACAGRSPGGPPRRQVLPQYALHPQYLARDRLRADRSRLAE
jgi:hypothetical protein